MSDASADVDAGSATPLLCPKCRQTMKATTHTTPRGSTTFEQCDACGGIWFDLMEHRHVRDEDPHAAEIDVRPAANISAEEQLKAPMRTCARCRIPMTRLKDVDRRDVIYDYCSVCNGTFFEAGEFRRYASKPFMVGLLGKLGF